LYTKRELLQNLRHVILQYKYSGDIFILIRCIYVSSVHGRVSRHSSVGADCVVWTATSNNFYLNSGSSRNFIPSAKGPGQVWGPT